MANGVYKHGRIGRINRPLGIGSIQPDDGGEPVIFPSVSVPGGRAGFDDLRPGQKVKYLLRPAEGWPVGIAEDVIPEE
ncbi:hypothetical protein [Paludisphaera mucosa]|uniref:CSD domain-containing protein n=1 Tax=Paludisphaera mucosa TaxID=3030827 RepID=A0ABT6F810_9BACT|nr:hypothetical protein [Paludisphaera mucosa]MDG3003659.1 hypothetical protein [Paludisphaera mucosa]